MDITWIVTSVEEKHGEPAKATLLLKTKDKTEAEAFLQNDVEEHLDEHAGENIVYDECTLEAKSKDDGSKKTWFFAAVPTSILKG